ncbi:MAG: hypothetical protein KME17_01820 [Cyanosarcina radialis HA8281-LM2]|jgi:hypothetical protein|nr:hypothetical protein [Cyanosarcina radialis HA8281-LM2]
MKRKLKVTFKLDATDRGFSLPVAMGTGLVLLMVGSLLIARSMQSQAISIGRSQTSNSLAIAEAGVARTLAQLTKSNNGILLTSNYDAINPKTGTTHLGADGIANDGDEENTAVDEWANPSAASSCASATSSGTPNISYSGTVGSDGQYTLKAYRYNSATKTGTLLIEGKKGTLASAYIAVTMSIDSNTSTVSDFPGVIAIELIDLYGRVILGSNGNVYYDPAFSTNPSLTGSAKVGDANRPDYLNAVKSGPSNGFTADSIDGTIVACKLTPTLPYTPQGTDLGTIKDKVTAISGTSGSISYYQANKIEINDTDTLDIDTTNGPVYLYVNGDIKMNDAAQIRHIRTDGIAPKVGDLRIIVTAAKNIELNDTVCIQTAFIYAPLAQLQLKGSGDGCPSSGSSNIDGVVWVKEIVNNGNSANSGIALPNDVSSLTDVLNSVNLPAKNKIQAINAWQRLKL